MDIGHCGGGALSGESVSFSDAGLGGLFLADELRDNVLSVGEGGDC